jgi:putative colanic acid biosynthesis UDP-glucose lipid carrier transferase
MLKKSKSQIGEIMENRHVFILIFILSVLDLVGVNSSCLVIGLFHLPKVSAAINYPLLLAVNLSWLISALANKLYKYRAVQTINKLIYKTMLTCCCQVLLLYFVASYMPSLHVGKTFYAYMLSAEIASLVSIRLLIYLIEASKLKLKSYRKIIAIVGCDDVSIKLADFFIDHKRSFNFAGHFKNINQADAKANLKDLRRNIQFAINYKLDEVYSTILPEDDEELEQVTKLAERHCVRVKYVVPVKEYNRLQKSGQGKTYSRIGYFNGMPILLNRPEPLNSLKNRILKRTFDIAFSLIVIILLLSWLIPILAIIIRLDSPGPVLFKQLRSGRNNKPFWCYKFRSMRVNKNSNKLQATKNDARVTKVGAFMRKTSIDELPQFFNVVWGNMSIVGPRPHMLKHTFEYRGVVDQYMIRLFSKPGITGWAQVNGYRGETKDQEQMQSRVNHDIWYMENWLLLYDVKIIYKTVLNVIKGQETAY